MRADQIHHLIERTAISGLAPRGGRGSRIRPAPLMLSSLMKAMINPVSACGTSKISFLGKKVRSLGGQSSCADLGGVQTWSQLVCPLMLVWPTLIMARTEPTAAHLLTSDIDPRDREFNPGETNPGRLLSHSRRARARLLRAASLMHHTGLFSGVEDLD